MYIRNSLDLRPRKYAAYPVRSNHRLDGAGLDLGF
jgi:hypothetical protein